MGDLLHSRYFGDGEFDFIGGEIGKIIQKLLLTGDYFLGGGGGCLSPPKYPRSCTRLGPPIG